MAEPKEPEPGKPSRPPERWEHFDVSPVRPVADNLQAIRIRARRDKVKVLLARQLTAGEIANALAVSARTIENDIRAVRRELAAELSSKTTLDWAGHVWKNYVARQRELWLMFQSEKQNSIKLALAREMRNSDRDVMASLQSLGVAHRQPEQLQVESRILAQLKTLDSGTLEQIANARDQRSLEQALGAFVGTEAVRELLQLTSGDTVEPMGFAEDEEPIPDE